MSRDFAPAVALVSLLTTHLPLNWDARDLDEATAWNILLYASSHQMTIEATSLELGMSSGTTIRNHLTEALGDSPRQVLALEQQLNQTLRAQLPRSFRRRLNSQPYDVAIDLVDLPYYGQRIARPKKCDAVPPKPAPPIFIRMRRLPSFMMINAMNSR